MLRTGDREQRSRRALPGLAASMGRSPRASRWPLSAWVFACFLALLSPWQPAFGQAQTGLEQILAPPKIDSADPMLLQADQMVYDNENSKITAKGNVEVYYGNYTLLSDSIVYDRNTNTLTAFGNVRIKDPDGAVITADHITLTDDFRDGFHRRVAARHQGRHAHRRPVGLTRGRQRYGVPEGLVHALQSLRGPSGPRAGVAHQGQRDHSSQRPGDDHLQERVLRFLRRARAVGAVLPERRPDGEAEVRLPHAELQPFRRARHCGADPVLLRAVGPLRLHLRADDHREGGDGAARQLAATHRKRRLQRRARRRVEQSG